MEDEYDQDNYYERMEQRRGAPGQRMQDQAQYGRHMMPGERAQRTMLP
jgi:hypothetical protein